MVGVAFTRVGEWVAELFLMRWGWWLRGRKGSGFGGGNGGVGKENLNFLVKKMKRMREVGMW